MRRAKMNYDVIDSGFRAGTEAVIFSLSGMVATHVLPIQGPPYARNFYSQLLPVLEKCVSEMAVLYFRDLEALRWFVFDQKVYAAACHKHGFSEKDYLTWTKEGGLTMPAGAQKADENCMSKPTTGLTEEASGQ